MLMLVDSLRRNCDLVLLSEIGVPYVGKDDKNRCKLQIARVSGTPVSTEIKEARTSVRDDEYEARFWALASS